MYGATENGVISYSGYNIHKNEIMFLSYNFVQYKPAKFIYHILGCNKWNLFMMMI